MKNPIGWLVGLGVIVVIGMVLLLTTIKITTVRGNELGIKETWSGGVENMVYQPKTYFLVPGWSQHIYTYDASSRLFVMNDKPMTEERVAAGREKDAYLVQSKEGQDMNISLNLRWRIDPAKLVSIHKTVGQEIEEKIIRPVVMRVVKDKATAINAIDAYSGEGLVKLQEDIQVALSGEGDGKELSQRGVIVENFVIEHIDLDPKYIEEIKAKQIATQKTLRAAEEQKAAEAQALVAKADAQADYNKQVVEAQRDATNTVIHAQAENEKAIIAAKAEQQKQILEAEGKRDAMKAIAEGTLAQGTAEAQAKKLMLQAYAVPGSELWTRVQVANSVAIAFGNIRGYLPSDMRINLLTDGFDKAVDSLTGNPIIQPAVLQK